MNVQHSIVLTIFILVCGGGSPIAFADEPDSTIYLRSGGELSGTIVSQTKEDKRNFVVVRTGSGSFLKLDKSKTIKRIVSWDSFEKAYQAALTKSENTPDGHLQMYEWCKGNGGTSKFDRQMNYHLKQAVKLDPSDKQTWQRLDYVQRPDGNWVPKAQHFSSLGYVKVKGRWVPSIQVEFDNQNATSEAHLNSRKKALKLWHKNVLSQESRDSIRSELFQLVDPISVGYLENRYLSKESNPDLRRLYVEAIGQVDSRLAHSLLVKYMIEDVSFDVRDQALSLLEQERYDRGTTVNRLARYLNHSSNEVINRAGRAIGVLKDEAGIIPLIGALITTHEVATGDDPDRMNMQFGSNGVGFGTGGPKSVKVTRKNDAVLQALRDISGQNNGFDIDAWKRWYVSERTIGDYDLRSSFNE